MAQINSWEKTALAKCIFVGHNHADSDSICSAVAAAELYDGVATRGDEEVSIETEWIFQHFETPVPNLFDMVLFKYADHGICLLDHNQTGQLAVGVYQHKDRIKGIIDHHAIQSGMVCTDKPIWVDIRPWGSTCSIIAHSFIRHQKSIKRKTGGLLLCGILSDTLNLKSPTTTQSDIEMAKRLTEMIKLKSSEHLGQMIMKAKGLMSQQLSPAQLVNGDFKIFNLARNIQCGFGTVETTDINAVLEKGGSKLDSIIDEMNAMKIVKNVPILFLSVVDVVSLKSQMVLCGPVERELARAAFPISEKDFLNQQRSVLDTDSRVSRKLEFIPPISNAIEKGWVPSDELKTQMDKGELDRNMYNKLFDRQPCDKAAETAKQSPKQKFQEEDTSTPLQDNHCDAENYLQQERPSIIETLLGKIK